MDQTVSTKLNSKLTHLHYALSHFIQQLFGQDASATLSIEREGERPTGLSISLQPSGKQTKSLNLLSVGERTMGALAFLFALMSADQESQGLPLAILDEVDAPLDEANIRRFCNFLKELAQEGTQFILITHQKATMEVADSLLGCDHRKGVSRVFSIRKEQDKLQLA
ncbi:MAG: AAA family ATPase [Deinococcales bacterium]